MKESVKFLGLLSLALLWLVSAPLQAEGRLRLATTTSTDNSGLLAVLHPPFEKAYDVHIDVIAVGTGKALRLAANGDVDVVLVHAPAAEQRFLEEGHGVDRAPVMHNDFVILGPQADPAGIAGAADAASALRRIAEKEAGFVSRGDDSGTHKKEMALWHGAGLEPVGAWYAAAGQGMGAVLRIADEKNAYTLSDRGTYIAYADKIALVPLLEGDPALFNPYHVIAVNPAEHPHVAYDLALKYIGFLTGPEAQKIIAGYKMGGQQLFHPDPVPAQN